MDRRNLSSFDNNQNMSVNTIGSADDGLIFYEISNESGTKPFASTEYLFKRSRYATGHYFTVTGCIIDRISGETYLRVSNAGIEMYVIYSEYVEYVCNHGQILGYNPGNAIIYLEDL